MNFNFLHRQRSRREMLGLSKSLAGSALRTHFFSAGLLGASTVGYATRANSHKVEVAGASHSVYVSTPKEVAAVIEELQHTFSRKDVAWVRERPGTLQTVVRLISVRGAPHGLSFHPQAASCLACDSTYRAARPLMGQQQEERVA
jgi:hypothetical protein